MPNFSVNVPQLSSLYSVQQTPKSKKRGNNNKMNLCADQVFDKMLLWRDMSTKIRFPSFSAAKLPDLRKTNKRRSLRMIKCRATGADGGRVAVGDDVFSVTTSSKYEVDYLGQSTKGDLNLKLDPLQSFGIQSKLPLSFVSFQNSNWVYRETWNKVLVFCLGT